LFVDFEAGLRVQVVRVQQELAWRLFGLISDDHQGLWDGSDSADPRWAISLIDEENIKVAMEHGATSFFETFCAGGPTGESRGGYYGSNAGDGKTTVVPAWNLWISVDKGGTYSVSPTSQNENIFLP
jgi:hypothetical protein